MVLVLTVVILQSISFANYALTTTTTNIIYGSAPYLTFDGGRTRVTNTEALLGISLSDGRTFTPTTNNSSFDNPIELPVAGQSFKDIGMLVPTDTNSIALSSLIGPPNNYWGDDDGDGQGVNGVTATGRLKLSIYDKNGQAVARNEVLTICKAPYRLILSNSEGTLTTRYGVPNESRFNAGNVTYRINPKKTPEICFARPNLKYGTNAYAGPADIWNPDKGFLTQSVTPSSYGLNFPTTGAHNLYFDLDIAGTIMYFYWEPVKHSGITATMTYPYGTSTRVRVTLTGPVAAEESGWEPDDPDEIDKPSLPQVFELVGRNGNAVIKYGFELKQWFVGRYYHVGDLNLPAYPYSKALSWCNSLGGYRVPKIRELTNATCQPERADSQDVCQGAEGATPWSNNNHYMRHIGGGLFSEWGWLPNYNVTSISNLYYWTSDYNTRSNFKVSGDNGSIILRPWQLVHGVCVYP
ncbi:hypothetical protein [Gilliamella apicola]|uniref:hypothetical protein n=1 Tax=Gilliamella apicola TaxID=1196095 RepID=UPI00080F3CAD|nr:hypothetical protein [Gilliamella apis]OCF98321.1 hypothetical protein A9G16_05325 [Gilliamella apis]